MRTKYNDPIKYKVTQITKDKKAKQDEKKCLRKSKKV
jgi:hypothetical protein